MNKWISVEDRLPEQDSEILVTSYRYQNPDKGRFYCVAIRMGDEYYEWNGEESSYDEPLYPITHWAQIEPPKE